MARVSIEIPDELRKKVEVRLSETGHASVERYIHWLLLEDADSIDYGAPEEVKVRSRADLERAVLEALDSPSREMTAADWDEMRRQFIARHGGPGAG